jgi:recombination DNA repair RAD52 pathway protein
MIPDELRTILLSPIRPGRVGKDGKGFSHVEAYEIRAHLIRLFDFDGWDSEILSMELVFESEKDGKWTVCYRAQCELMVRWPEGRGSRYTEWATGEAKNQPSRGDAHDLAIKTAESQALKRCAMNLGDQYGLSLYKKGSMEPLVRQTWNMTRATPSANPPAVDEHVTESVPESEQQEPAPDNHVQSEPPKEHTDEDTKALRVADLTTQLIGAGSRCDSQAVRAAAVAIGKEKLVNAWTYDGNGDGMTLGALLQATLKKVARAA